MTQWTYGSLLTTLLIIVVDALVTIVIANAIAIAIVDVVVAARYGRWQS